MKDIISNNLFEFQNYQCKCNIDVVNNHPGEPPEYMIKAYKEKGADLIRFAYSSGIGLNLCSKGGAMLSKNILGQLLALDVNNIGDTLNYFEKFGFLFELEEDRFLSVNYEDIKRIIERLKAVVLLMSALSGKKDIRKILELTAYLLYSEPIEIQSDSYGYKSNKYCFTEKVRSYSVMPDCSRCNSSDRCLHIKDSITQREETIHFEDIMAIEDGEDLKGIVGSKDDLFKHLFALYTNCPIQDSFQRTIIDFFYHYQTEVGVFDSIELNNITYYDSTVKTEVPDYLKETLLQIAKQVVSQEVNSNISRVTPAFDIDSLSHSWQINSFLTALYFSVFYMKPNVELYKECENPRCKHQKYFLISTTATNKKYCCDACANAVAQQRSRLRKMNKS